MAESSSIGEWILADPTATNMEECMEYVARAYAGGNSDATLYAYQSEHASFRISTPTATVRLSHGRLHQVAMRDPTDSYDLPEHRTWQMNVALENNDGVSLDAGGVIGQTSVPTLDANGEPIMTGMAAIRGIESDCELCPGTWYPRGWYSMAHTGPFARMRLGKGRRAFETVEHDSLGVSDVGVLLSSREAGLRPSGAQQKLIVLSDPGNHKVCKRATLSVTDAMPSDRASPNDAAN